VRTAVVDTPGSTRDRETIEFVLVEDLPSLVWVANLAGLELHVPQWRLGEDDEPLPPDRMVVDLDPGPPAGLVDCCRVALLVRDALAADGLALHPKTSGSKGLQGYVALTPTAAWDEVHGYAKQVAERVERQAPRQVVSRMEKARRRGKVLVDWSQNHRAKTTVAPYSLRGLPEPSVSTPVSWVEVEAVADGADPQALRFLAGDVVARVAAQGDLLAPLLTDAATLP
jgi:bifunctional non-homologous end joining protein LigD